MRCAPGVGLSADVLGSPTGPPPEGARLCGALYDAATIWPAGIDPTNFGAVRIKPARPRMLPDEDTEPNALRGRFVATMWGRWVVRLN